MVWVPQYLSNASSEVFQWTFRLEFIVHDHGMRNMRRNFFAHNGSNVKLFMSNLRTFTNIYEHLPVAFYEHLPVAFYEHLPVAFYEHLPVAFYEHLTVAFYEHAYTLK